MISVVINPKSSGHSALKKWASISPLIPHDKVLMLEDFLKSNVSPNLGDFYIAAGGDGCLHAVVNFIIQKFGTSSLEKVAFGYIGLGSNNSFLQPVNKKYLCNGVPVQISPTLHMRDLIQVTIKNKGVSTNQYVISNASLGFLSYANLTFNQNPWVQLFKKISVTVADVASFFMTLSRFKSLTVSVDHHNSSITNLHWLKSPYFTKDLHFKTAALDSGFFDFYTLPGKARLEIMTRFISMLIRKKMSAGFETHHCLKSLTVTSKEVVPLEIDGEVYFGDEFVFQILPKAMRTMS